MARSRRWRRGAPDPGATRADDDVDLGAPEHAWWAQADLAEPPTRDDAPERAPEPASEAASETPAETPAGTPAGPRDVLAEHLGSDWRSAFGFDHAGPVVPPPKQRPEPEREPIAEPEAPVDTSDPYAVLGVEHAASWDEIVDAHRALARRHHPDRMVGRPPDELEAAEQRIRDINVAYQELRVRRGR